MHTSVLKSRSIWWQQPKFKVLAQDKPTSGLHKNSALSNETCKEAQAPLFNKEGLGPEARTHLDNLHSEKKLFETEAKIQVPEDTFRQIQPSSDRISVALMRRTVHSSLNGMGVNPGCQD
jgi:hypothetical protein